MGFNFVVEKINGKVPEESAEVLLSRAEDYYMKALFEAERKGAKAVEERQYSIKDKKDLMAIHNISEDKLNEVLNLGGYPMPSIAITRNGVGHEGFGDISAVFGRETIDPELNYKNKIYSADAYTARFPNTEYKLNEEMNLKDSILPNAVIKIQSFDIQKKYKLKYNFCSNNKCYDSYEYLLPKINSNYDKALLKISGNLDGNINGVIDLYDFIYKFGELHYTIDGIDKVQLIELAEVNSKHSNTDGTYYIEVVDEVKNATNMSFWFKIRNKVYKYILK